MKYGAIQDGDLPALSKDVHEDIASHPPGLFTGGRGLTAELPASSCLDDAIA